MYRLRSAIITRFITTMADSDFLIPISQALCFGTCARYTHSLERGQDLLGSALFSTDSPTPETPVCASDWKKNRQCAHSETIACWFDDTIGTTQSVNFGVITFTYWFRLECFAVYASSPLLPPEMQDSLRSDLANLLRRGFHPQETVQLFPAHHRLHR